jgi:hypothetical protein
MNKKFISLVLLVSFTVPTMINAVSKNTSGGRSSASSYTPQPSPQDDIDNSDSSNQSTSTQNVQNQARIKIALALGIPTLSAATYLLMKNGKLGSAVETKIKTLEDKIKNGIKTSREWVKDNFKTVKEKIMNFANKKNKQQEKETNLVKENV